MTTTTDRKHPGINSDRGDGQNEAYIVLSREEREKGFVRPLRNEYVHYVCGAVTHMHADIAETYARDPKFYGQTFCCKCGGHFPVDQFEWGDDSGQKVGE